MLRAITRSLGTCDKLLMIVSVMPSLRYSLSGSPSALPSGRTAIESIVFEGRRRLIGTADPMDVRGRFPLTPCRTVLRSATRSCIVV